MLMEKQQQPSIDAGNHKSANELRQHIGDTNKIVKALQGRRKVV